MTPTPVPSITPSEVVDGFMQNPDNTLPIVLVLLSILCLVVAIVNRKKRK